MNMSNIERELQVNNIRFLMARFQSMYSYSSPYYTMTVTEVREFKETLQEFVDRGQITKKEFLIILEIFGIENTDVFKKNAVENKIFQINWLLDEADKRQIIQKNLLKEFKEMLDKETKVGHILKSTRDCIYKIYGLDDVVTTPVIGKINTTKPPEPKATKYKTSSGIDRSRDVRYDMGEFLPSVVSEIYYEYLNPSYDGCCGSSKYLYVKLIDCIDKPKNVQRYCIHAKLSDDGCHATFGYLDVPKKYYKSNAHSLIYDNVSKPKEKPKEKPSKISSSPYGCTGGMPSTRFC